MADILILDGTGETWRLVFHIPIPDVNNAVGVNLRDALANSGIGLNSDTGRRTILPTGNNPGEITVVEENALDNGALIEVIVSRRLESGGTSDSDRQTTVREFYATELGETQTSIALRLKYFGKEHTAT